MSDIPESLKELILELMKNEEEINSVIKPVLNGVAEHETVLARQSELIKKVFDIALDNKGEIDDIKNRLELVNVVDYKTKYIEHKDMHEELQKVLKDIKYKDLSYIYDKAHKYNEINDDDKIKIEYFIKKYPEDDRIYSIIGSIYWMIDEDKIFSMFQKTKELNPDNSVGWCGSAIFQKGDKQNQLKIIDEAMKFDVITKCPNFLYNISLKYRELKEYDLSLKYISEYMEIVPDNPLGYFIKGTTLHVFMDEPAKAIPIYEKGLEVNPKDEKIMINLGSAYALIRMYEKAKTKFLKVLELNNNNIFALRNLSRLLFEVENYDEAITYFNKLNKLEPNDPCDECFLARTLKKSDNKEDALILFEKILSMDIECYGKYNNYLELITDIKPKKEVDKIIDTMKKDYIDDYKLTIALIMHYIENKDDKKALKLISNIEKLDILSPYDNNSVAYAYYMLDQPQKGLIYSERAIKDMPKHAAFIDTHAGILSKMGRDKESKKYFDIALKYASSKDHINWVEMKTLYDRLNLSSQYEEIRNKFFK